MKTLLFALILTLFSFCVYADDMTYVIPPDLTTYTGGNGAAFATLSSTTVNTVSVTAGGSGYSVAPTVAFTSVDGNGSGAAATSHLTAGAVSSVTVDNHGSGYTAPPIISLNGTYQSGIVNTLSLVSGGNYNAMPTVNFFGGGGTGATATAALTPTTVASIAITYGGFGYANGEEVHLPTGDGVSNITWTPVPASPSTLFDKVDESAQNDNDYIYGAAAAKYIMFTSPAFAIPSDARIVKVVVYSRTKCPSASVYGSEALRIAGINYMGTSHLLTTGFSDNSYTWTTNPSSGMAWTVADINGSGMYPIQQFGWWSSSAGSNTQYLSHIQINVYYDFAPTVSFSGGGGTGAAAVANTIGDAVSSITITNPGSGYTSEPTVSFDGGGCCGGGGVIPATGNVLLTPTPVASITLVAAGSGYSTAPTVSFSGGGSGANATATVSGAGSQATATAVLASAPLTALTIIDGGMYYIDPPIVSFSTAEGTGATATATVSSGVIDTLSLLAGGSYTSPPTITFKAVAVDKDFRATAAQASGLATLNGSSLVVQNPASATATPGASKIPISDGSGKLDSWITGTWGYSTITTSTTPYVIPMAGMTFIQFISTKVGTIVVSASGGIAGQTVSIMCENTASTTFGISFGTNFKSSGVVIPAATSKAIIITFAYDGTNWNEVSRSAAFTY